MSAHQHAPHHSRREQAWAVASFLVWVGLGLLVVLFLHAAGL